MRNEIVKEIIFFSQRIEEDDFKKEGFETLEEALFWQERGCGIASLRMIIASLNSNVNLPNYKTLINQGIEINAYCPQGWIHNGLLNLAKRYMIDGRCYRNKSSLDVASALKNGELCICSVSVCFDQNKKGGHLIVINGFKEKNNKIIGFYVNHPSSVEKYNFKNKFIAIDMFENSFSGNFISFFLKKNKNNIIEKIYSNLFKQRKRE